MTTYKELLMKRHAFLKTERSPAMSVRIIECNEPAELWHHYGQQSEPQPCYIELDIANKTLLASYSASIGNAVPFTVYHGIDRRYPIPCLTAEAVNRVMGEIAPLADRILADSEVEWDGNNNVGTLGEDAQTAEEWILERLGLQVEGNPYGPEHNQGFEDSDLVDVWTTDSAVSGEEVKEYGITADTTDERLAEIEAEILRDLAGVGSSGVAVCYGLDTYLAELRDALRRERDGDPDDTEEFFSHLSQGGWL